MDETLIEVFLIRKSVTFPIIWLSFLVINCMRKLTLIMTIAAGLFATTAGAGDFFTSNNPKVTIANEFEARVWLEFLHKETQTSQDSETAIYNANRDFEKARELLPKIQETK
jgi:hypothetical protein